MKMFRWRRILLIVAIPAVSLCACQSGQQDMEIRGETASSVLIDKNKQQSTAYITANNSPGLDGASPGKIGAPITIRYRMLGEPAVGEPLTVDFQFLSRTSTEPLRIRYGALDTSALTLPKDQVRELSLSIDRETAMGVHAVTVIPQVQGRSYLEVSATINTANGSMTKHTSIPIQVGTGGPALESNGELLQDPAGRTVISMPAKED